MFFFQHNSGIYIMQNTMVRGGEMASWGKKMKLGVREKNEKGERKKEENYTKKGKRGLKNESFWAIISNHCAGGLPAPPLGS